MKKLIMRSMIFLLFLALTGCSKCEHKYDDGVITKEATCIEDGEKTYTCTLCKQIRTESIPKAHVYQEETIKDATFDEEGEKKYICQVCGFYYTESIPCKDAEVYNCDIYERMKKYYDNEDYINALVLGSNAISNSKEAKKKIDKLVDEIISEQSTCIREQLKNAFEDKNYEIISAIYSYRFRYPAILNSDQIDECELLGKVQGIFNYYEGTKSDNTQVNINGYNMKIGEKEYSIDVEIYQPFIEFAPNIYKLRLRFEDGYFEPAEIIYGDGIEITFNDRTHGIYYTDDGIDALEERKEIRNEAEPIKARREQAQKQERLDNVPKIGMTADEVRKTNWGEPDKINKTTYSWGTTEQWCYNNYRYIYFDDGIVTAIQE